MANKNEERDWSEIIAEVRTKAKSEVEEAIDDIRPKVKEMVEKLRAANFHAEAEEFLVKLRKMADEFSKSEDAPSKPKASKAKKNTGKRPALYRTPEGKEYSRALKDWSDKQKANYRIK